LRKIEKLWFLTVGALVVKDTIISLTTPGTLPGEDVARLGMTVTHPTELSLLATLVFWLSFTSGPEKYSFVKWLLRAFLIFVIIAAKTRISIIAFMLAGFVRFIVSARDPLRRFIVVSATTGTLLTFLLLNLSFSQPWATRTVGYLKRGQDKVGLSTLTSRTLIWRHVLPKTLETPIIGHGYGVSRLTMGKPRYAGFQPLHCHNAMLEVFFSTGLLGLFPFILFLAYSLKWIWDYPRLREVFSTDLTLHAVCSVVILLGSSLSEAILGVRLSPVQPLLFLYLLALDRKVALCRVAT
jgi:O-antigen ligase